MMMSKKEKLLNKWKNNPPAKENVEKVFNMLESFGFTKRSDHGGSHTTWFHQLLEGESDTFLDPIPGEFSFAIKKGRMVKKCYLKDIVKAIIIVELKGVKCNDEN